MADFTNTPRRSSKGWVFATLGVVVLLLLLIFAGGGENLDPGGTAPVETAPAVESAPVVTD